MCIGAHTNATKHIFLSAAVWHEIVCVSVCVWLVVYICLSACVCWEARGREALKQGVFVLYCGPRHSRGPSISRGKHSCFHRSTTWTQWSFYVQSALFVENKDLKDTLFMGSALICQQWVFVVSICKVLHASRDQMTQAGATYLQLF